MVTKVEVVDRIGQLDSILCIINDIRRSELRELEQIERGEVSQDSP